MSKRKIEEIEKSNTPPKKAQKTPEKSQEQKIKDLAWGFAKTGRDIKAVKRNAGKLSKKWGDLLIEKYREQGPHFQSYMTRIAKGNGHHRAFYGHTTCPNRDVLAKTYQLKGSSKPNYEAADAYIETFQKACKEYENNNPKKQLEHKAYLAGRRAANRGYSAKNIKALGEIYKLKNEEKNDKAAQSYLEGYNAVLMKKSTPTTPQPTKRKRNEESDDNTCAEEFIDTESSLSENENINTSQQQTKKHKPNPPQPNTRHSKKTNQKCIVTINVLRIQVATALSLFGTQNSNASSRSTNQHSFWLTNHKELQNEGEINKVANELIELASNNH